MSLFILTMEGQASSQVFCTVFLSLFVSVNKVIDSQ